MFTASLGSLRLNAVTSGRKEPYRTWEDLYRQQWRWDGVVWGSHCVDCYPGNCPFRVYVKGGLVLREPYMFPGWSDAANVEPGMVKWLHLAAGYGHLKYRPWHWQPVPVDRGVGVDVEKLPAAVKAG